MLDIKDIKANVLSGNSPKIIILEKDTSGDGDDILTRKRGKKKVNYRRLSAMKDHLVYRHATRCDD